MKGERLNTLGPICLHTVNEELAAPDQTMAISREMKFTRQLKRRTGSRTIGKLGWPNKQANFRGNKITNSITVEYIAEKTEHKRGQKHFKNRNLKKGEQHEKKNYCFLRKD